MGNPLLSLPAPVLLSLLLCSLPAFTYADSQPRILIYSATADFRHDSIPTAVDALTQRVPSLTTQWLGSSSNLTVDHTEDETRFTDDGLKAYDALVFLDNTGEVLSDSGKDASHNYLNRGGNFIGIHSASDCLRNTTWYGNETGAFFDYHPYLQNATINVLDNTHPSTSMLPSRWSVQDEMYNFKSDPRAIGAVVILSADESTYNDPGPRNYNQGTPHPTAWYQERGAGVDRGSTAGRSFYTSLGHLNETWADDLFLGHIAGGISWALQSNTTLAFNSSGLVGNPTSESSSGSASSSSPSSSSSSNLGSRDRQLQGSTLWIISLCLLSSIATA